MSLGIRFDVPEVEEAAKLILQRFDYCNPFLYPFRFALAVGQRVSFRHVALNAPSLDIGVNDGSTARVIHHGKPRFSWGGDMPEESTYESRGLFVTPDFNVYDNFLGLDACDLPFPDNSFNTITATEVFSYGMDRGKLLAELVRVLAPGGTLAFSDNSEEIRRFPALHEGLKEYVRALLPPLDGREDYRRILTGLGVADFHYRPFFDSALAGFTISLMYAANPSVNHEEYHKLVMHDARLRRFYVDGLLALALGMDREFRDPEGPKDGWHAFVSCRKPGRLNPALPVPQPVCPVCRSAGLDRSLCRCACTSCGREYRVRYGVPYLLRDYSTVYSPKEAGSEVANRQADRRIDAALTRSYPDVKGRLGAGNQLLLYGIDPATSFTVKHLRDNGLEVLAVVATDPHHVGYQVEQAPVIGLGDLRDLQIPVLCSGYAPADSQLVGVLRGVGFRGPVWAFQDEADGCRVKDLPLAAGAATGRSKVGATARLWRGLKSQTGSLLFGRRGA